MKIWTVVRFPDGSWSTGGKPDSPEYQMCEVFRIVADTRDKAKRIAQQQRRQNIKNNNSNLDLI